MDAADDPATEQVVFQKSSQVSGTEVLLNVIGKHAHLDPCAILYLVPKDADGRKFSIKRLAPMIRDTPALSTRFVPAKSRETGNTIDYKKFEGGDITIVGANSPSNLASLPIRLVLSDEDDRQAASSGDEGDPWELAWTRTTTFPNRKGFRVSTPAMLATSRIIPAFEESDKRFFNVPCPHCGQLHAIHRENLRWEKKENGTPKYETVRLICPKCGKGYDDDAKRAAVEDPRSRWIATAPFNGIRGYFLWAAYSPFLTLSEIVAKIHSAMSSGDPAKIQVLFNTVFGEGYEGIMEKIDEAKIAERAETYAAPVPRGVLFLTVGLDTQDDRIEAEVVGWDDAYQSWSIDYKVFPGDPDIPEGKKGSPWDAVTDLLNSRWRHERGFDMSIGAAVIDHAGHRSQSVRSYCRQHRTQIFPIIGRAGNDRDPVKGPTRIRFGKSKSQYVFHYVLGVDKLKGQVLGRLQLADVGPGYCHFPKGRDVAYYEQLTAERLVTEIKKNRRVTEWRKVSEDARNEALDCRVYAYAALLIRAPRWDVAKKKQRLMAELYRKAAEPDTPADAEPEETDDAIPTPAQDETPEKGHHAKKSKRHRRRSGFVNAWRT